MSETPPIEVFGPANIYIRPPGADFADLGWCDSDGLAAEPLTSERLADFSTALGGSSVTITGIPPRLFRILSGLRHPHVRRMHTEYARRLKARRRRRQ